MSDRQTWLLLLAGVVAVYSLALWFLVYADLEKLRARRQRWQRRKRRAR